MTAFNEAEFSFENRREKIKRCEEIGITRKDMAHIFDLSKSELKGIIEELREKGRLGKGKPTRKEGYPKIFQEYLDMREKYYNYDFWMNRSDRRKNPFDLYGAEKEYYKVLEEYLERKEILGKVASASFKSRWDILPRGAQFSKNLGFFRILDEILDLGWSIRRRLPTLELLKKQAKIHWDKVCYRFTNEEETVASKEELLVRCLQQASRPKVALSRWNRGTCRRLDNILEENLRTREKGMIKFRFKAGDLDQQKFIGLMELDLTDWREYSIRVLDDIASRYDVSRERCRQIIDRGIAKMKGSGDLQKLNHLFTP